MESKRILALIRAMLHTSPCREERQVDDQQQSRGPTRSQLLWAGATVGLLTIAILIGYRYGISLWDWIKLLVVPAVIAGGGLWFNRQQREREIKNASAQREQELEIAERRTQDEALQTYLDQMSDMLIPNKEQPSLYKARPGDILSTVARARTLTVLPRLDGNRKARVVQSLYESGLISNTQPILTLSGADLSGAILINVNLREADLSGAILTRADLREANLYGANLSGADLREAILYDARLGGADLSEANLRGAFGNYPPDGQWLKWVASQPDPGPDALDLEQGISMFVPSFLLVGTTMPNGQKYEDWIEHREHREEDGKNDGSS